ncbi:MAG: hypothetical protein A2161_02365 [Candidatus Schekmanbacteria bacterium RBG_13_48_7]|uniref:Glycosyl transferase family 1 domain-containing protein n=1 Tax=Candidatus Schekmanbacteria bacterium RBG_13_48_7 TaxID=1817878 RepID=A0A1F7RXZ7_9BACT|nr:MAG: hypothetical protein A2161_02365 [Candidatus Schekmanbacteria bacterium RBG_13_48_7]
MNLLYITWNFPPRKGGMENYNWRLSNELSKKHNILIITRHLSESKNTDTIKRAPFPGLISFFLYGYVAGKRMIRGNSINGVIGGSASVVPLLKKLSTKSGLPKLVLTHGFDLTYPGMCYQTILKRSLKSIDYFVSNSNFTAQILQKTGIQPEKITVIPPGVDTEFYTPCDRAGIAALKARYGLQDRRIILFVGRLVHRKGILKFTREVFPQVVRHCKDAVLIIVGDEPTEAVVHKERLKFMLTKSVNDLGLQKSVIVRGWIDSESLRDHYRFCDFCILPAIPVTGNDHEGFGMVIIEAAACAKPTVAVALGGIPDAIINNQTGILLQPWSPEELADNVIKLLNDPARCAELGNNARNRAVEKFDWNIVTAAFCSLAEKIFQ